MKMDQRMVLAPRMIQSMEILQLPLQALEERIEQELLSNPVLERDETNEASDNHGNNDQQNQADNEIPDGERLLSIKDDNSKTEDFARLDSAGSEFGEDFSDYFDRSTATSFRRNDGESDRKLEAMQNTAAPSISLREHLYQQWLFVEAEPIVKKAGQVIIDFIEDTGYLTVDLNSLAEYVKEPVTAEQMNQALELVQTLEPSGVGARDLPECLIIQLNNLNRDCSLELEIIGEHLKNLEMNRYPAIAKKTGRSIEEIQQAIKTIATLDPRPGLQLGRHENHFIMPDVIVEYDEEHDEYTARLTDGSLPSLRINTQYTQMLRQKDLGANAKEFLNNNVRSAKWLIESIQQRKATLLRVVHHVLHTQREFLDNGPLHLKPLPMVDVADKLGIHVGTVSRAVSGKYLQTPIGIFPLRSFFSGGTETANGDSVSWDAVKAKLQEIVDAEDKADPFNDDQLVDELKKHGITLARRTVAKYRGILNIPPARRRKQFT